MSITSWCGAETSMYGINFAYLYWNILAATLVKGRHSTYHKLPSANNHAPGLVSNNVVTAVNSSKLHVSIWINYSENYYQCKKLYLYVFSKATLK